MGGLRELLNQIVDAGFNLVALLLSPKKWTAFQTALSYSKTMLAAVGKFVPIVAVLTGGSPAISQAPPARPEEVGPHVPSKNQGSDAVQEGRKVLEGMVATANAIYPSVWDVIKVEDRGRWKIVYGSSPPNPPTKSTDEDQTPLSSLH